jgi:hypothetical protein
LAVLVHLAEGCGVRQTARLVGALKDTVTQLAWVAGEHARDELVGFSSEAREIWLEGKWTLGGKKKNYVPMKLDHDCCGDYYDQVAYDAEHRLVLAVVPGSRSIEDAEAIDAALK